MKTIYIKSALIIYVLILHFSSLKAENNKDSLELLFIGNSYFVYNDLPSLAKNLVISTGKDVFVDSYIAPGVSLDEHASSDIVEEKIYERDWDYVILIGSGATMAYPDIFTSSHNSSSLTTLKNKIKDNCSSTNMILCMCWAYEDGITFSDGTTDSYEGMQNSIYNFTMIYSNSIGFMVAPVGWAWFDVLKEKEFPLHYLHREDWNHPNIKGSYLMACVVYSTIYEETSVGLNYYADLTSEDASYFQQKGSTMVLENLELWNISSPTADNLLDQKNEITRLYQNSPNPFNSNTLIKYNVLKTELVKINVYNILGELVSVLVNEVKTPGEYSINFHGENLKNGIYFYNLKTESSFQTRKMQVLK